MALKDHMQARVAELLDRVAALEQKNAYLREAHTDAWYDAQRLETELEAVHEFIADVRLGIRDLSEYEEVCRRAGLVA